MMKAVLEAVVDLARKAVHQARISWYLASGRRPWTRGYAEYRERSLAGLVRDEARMTSFAQPSSLPAGHGYRLDARMVEIPWLLARLSKAPGRLLDAGSSLNRESVLAEIAARKQVVIFTLAPEGECHWRRKVSYVYGDLRELPFVDAYFDEIACISTLEHVGMDNSRYEGAMAAAAQTRGSYVRALREMRRVLKPGGRLFVSVPFGRFEDHGWFRQFDGEHVDQVIAEFAPAHWNETVFSYTAQGWRVSDRASSAACEFFDARAASPDGRSMPVAPDYAPGERAVICLELGK